MREVVVVDAIRTPFGRRGGSLSTLHAVDLLGRVQREVLARAGVEPDVVDQVIGGCVGQVGMQSMNVTRTAWLAAGLPLDVPVMTVDTQCGSSQQASTLAFGMIKSGVADVVVACGVEVMSRVPIGSTTPSDPDVGKPVNRTYWKHYEFTSQFEGAERMATKWGISRAETDAFGKESQDRAQRAWSEGRFGPGVMPVECPSAPDASGSTATATLERDEGLRTTSLEALATLTPTARPDGIHTAATSSQIADGASAVVMMTAERAEALACAPLAEVVDVALVGCDPVLMLEGPIPATQKLLEANGLSVRDIDVFEINEAFASVVLAWEREIGPDMSRVNPNGGAIAMGHPLGATGTALLGKAVHELHRTDTELALVTMCCGGGLGTGTLLRRR